MKVSYQQNMHLVHPDYCQTTTMYMYMYMWLPSIYMYGTGPLTMYSDVILYLQRASALDGLQEGVDLHLRGVAYVLPIHLEQPISRLQDAMPTPKVKVHRRSKYSQPVERREKVREKEKEKEREL